jgi:N utilization substance protein A
VLIPNALQPAEVEQVLLCDMIGRAIALVSEEHLSQAIGRFGQNVRLASKLCSWDIEIMTAPELERQIERAMEGFMEIEGMTEEVAQQLVEQGYLSYDDLSVIEPDALMEMGNWSQEEVDAIVYQAEVKAEEQEIAEEERKYQDKLEKERRATEELDRKEGRIAAPPPAPVAEVESASTDSVVADAIGSAADESVGTAPVTPAPAAAQAPSSDPELTGSDEQTGGNA